MSKLSHNDAPIHIDAFGQGEFIRQIADVIKTCDAPKGIAINGYWGSGKTSALLQLHKELTGVLPNDTNKPSKPGMTPIWFEAWRHQNEALPIVALLHEIRTKLGAWNKFRNNAEKLSTITLTGILGAFDETLKAASGGVMSPALSKIPEIAAQWEKDNYHNKLASQHLSQLLEEAIDQALGKDKNNPDRKLVIFIDDLDRCMPDTALKLLEGIKVYLNLRNCVVIFGMDQRQIENSLRKALNLKDGSNDGDHHAREYLEKICQDIYHLPIPDKQQKSAYLYDLLKNLDLSCTPKQQRTHLDELKRILDNYDCLPANPRKIKALANRLATVFRKLPMLPAMVSTTTPNALISKGLKVEYGLLTVTAIIYTFHRSLNEQLAQNPTYISTLIGYANNPPPPLATPDPIFEPMRSLVPSFNGTADLPVNPSDSHVFRLHRLLIDLGTVIEAEIKPFLNL
ncbi:KAP family P-loop NTPase fold protein [Methylomonas fluvii]|uniref:KAP family P-loop NTPase fold protein n=1 Tax=Methylomonas fluvii TaxID=1854564 RepID=UPI001CE09E03|nr:P-loop NTPase fold protein [Methylomonas fluvii]